MPQGPQRHPSRDQHNGPAEYTNVEGRGIYLQGSGHYANQEELDYAKEYWVAEGALTSPEVMKEARPHFEPAQGRMFHPDEHETKVRLELGEKRLRDDGNPAVAEMRDRALRNSVIPTSHLQPREGLRDTAIIQKPGMAATGMAGYYQGPPTSTTRDYIAVDPGSREPSSTVVHEMGHRRHLGTEPDSSNPRISHPRSWPDPLKEGIADAYEDRFGGHDLSQVAEMRKDIEHSGRKFPSYQYTGYSTDPERAEGRGWKPEDRALYAAVRAHGSETGEHTDYQVTGSHPYERFGPNFVYPTVDATLHHLMSTSPHAVQALRQTGLKDVGAAAFRRHQDRQLLTQGQEVQGSLFNEIRAVDTHGKDTGKTLGFSPTYDAIPDFDKWETAHDEAFHKAGEAADEGEYPWPRTMSHNQFGEVPRTSTDVGKTLNVHPRMARERGFQ